jgi:UDP-N-acetylmuramoyl-tripeptide--D-alanyl-D-alanine ligase
MELYSFFQKHPVVSTDSRNCPDGSIFFALKGENFNANAFALSALEKGCSLAVVDEAEFAVDERFILVENVLESLQNLAKTHREKLGTTVIGITGTNGKTTTKELIASVLKEKYYILYTQGNLNNHIGVPLTLLQLKPEHKLAIIEMGANHPCEIKTLCEIAKPDYGIITNVGKAHLEGFGSFEGVKKTKGELYDFIGKFGKNIFINADNKNLIEMAVKSGFNTNEVLKYSMNSIDENTINGSITDCSPLLEMNCKVNNFESVEIKTHLIGSYNAENVLAAVTIGDYFGVSLEEIKHGLENYIPQNNRSQLTITDKNKLVVDAYNANPTSMRAAILNFSQMHVEHKTLILGDMLELGEHSHHEHQEVVELLEQNRFENVFLVGPEFQNTKNSYACFEKSDELARYLDKNPIRENYILIKGSRGIKLEKVLPLL